jgi:hypothetical protein
MTPVSHIEPKHWDRAFRTFEPRRTRGASAEHIAFLRNSVVRFTHT